MRPLQAYCHLGLGTLYAKAEQREQARADYLRLSRSTVPWNGLLAAPGGGGAGEVEITMTILDAMI